MARLESLSVWRVLLSMEMEQVYAQKLAVALYVRLRASTDRLLPVMDLFSDLTQTSALFLTAITQMATLCPLCSEVPVE